MPRPSREPVALDDPAAPLDIGRTQSEADRIEALARFSTATLQKRRGDLELALRNYQRAFRYDPTSQASAREAIHLAAALDRDDEACRYAALAPGPCGIKPVLLKALAERLAERGEIDAAIVVLKHALDACDEDTTPTLRVLLRVELGRQCAIAGRFQDAADSLTIVADVLADPEEYDVNHAMLSILLNPVDSLSRVMGEVFLTVGEPDRAEAAFSRLPGGAEAGPLDYYRARIALQRDDPAEALTRLESYFEKQRSDEGAAPYLFLREVLDELAEAKPDDNNGRTVEAAHLRRLEQLREEAPENRALALALLRTLVEQERYEDAAKVLDASFQEDTPPEVLTIGARVDFETRSAPRLLETLARLYESGRPLDSAGDVLRRIVDDADLLTTLKQAAESEVDTPGQTPAPADNGKTATAYARMAAAAHLLLRAERVDEAQALLMRAVRLQQEGEGRETDDSERATARLAAVLLDWASRLLDDHHRDQAIKTLEYGVAHTEGRRSALFGYYLAGVLQGEGEHEKATRIIQEAALKAPSALMQSRLAWIYLASGRLDDAEELYQAIIARYDGVHDSPATRESVAAAKSILSSLRLRRGDEAQAVELLEQVLDEFPNDPGALNDLGYLWADAGENLPRALAMIERAVEAQPDNGAYRDSLGWVLHRLGRHDEAVKELKHAARLHPDPEVLEHLGDAHLASGQKDEARHSYGKAKEQLEASEPSPLHPLSHAQRLDRLQSKIGSLDDPG